MELVKMDGENLHNDLRNVHEIFRKDVIHDNI